MMDIYSWGANSYGHLGLNNTEDQLYPQKIDSFLEDGDVPNLITGGGGHTAMLINSGKLFVCGWNDCGQLGLGHTENVTKFSLLQFASTIKHVACGWNHTLLVTDVDECFSFGSNAFHQLGNSRDKKELHPVKVEGIAGNVKFVAAGMRHSVALTGDGYVYSWGCGKKGQLGLQEEGLHSNIKSPTRVQFDEDVIIKDVKAGAEFTAALSVNGDVYCWGNNLHGQCGLPGTRTSVGMSLETIKRVHKPTKINLSEKVCSIHTGWSHVIAITESQRVLSWGRGDYGQLGRTCFESRHEAVVIDCFDKKSIFSISGGSEHNISCTDDGNLFVWGWNEHGMCATGDEENVAKPRHVTLFNDQKPLLIGCGAGTSIVCIRSIFS